MPDDAKIAELSQAFIDITSEPDFSMMSDAQLDEYLAALRKQNEKRIPQFVNASKEKKEKKEANKAKKEAKAAKAQEEEVLVDLD